MRKAVNSKLFLMRKKLDNLLFTIFPNSWIPLYTMVGSLLLLGDSSCSVYSYEPNKGQFPQEAMSL